MSARPEPPVTIRETTGDNHSIALAFDRLGGTSARALLLATLVENAALLAASPLIDRIHPAVRDGSWPPLTGNPRAAAVSVSGHLLYAGILGALLSQKPYEPHSKG